MVVQALSHRGESPVPPVRPELGLGRVLTALADQHWSDVDNGGSRAPYPAHVWLPEVQLMVARERAGDPSGLALAAKGGHNDEAHNHLDVGSYLVALDSTPVLIDLGQPTYTAFTFTERRYEIWTMASSWHNLPEIRGQGQGVGRQYAAGEVVERWDAPGCRPGEGESCQGRVSSLELELAAAYPQVAAVHSYWRRISLDRRPGAGPVVRIEDRWQLDPAGEPAENADVVLHHVIAGDVLEHRPGRLLVRALSGSVAEMRWDTELGAGALERRGIEDPLLAASWGTAVHRLKLTADGSGTATVTLQELREPGA